MNRRLQNETEKLARSWKRHEPGWLRDYLVAGVENPRLNLQSILSRQFLARHLASGRFGELMNEECRFGAVMNWLADLVDQARETEELAVVLHALHRGADNAEGLPLPSFVGQTFANLPVAADGLTIPNYIESFLSDTRFADGRPVLDERSLATFQNLWQTALGSVHLERPPSVLEPACGSANDYRFLRAFGLARLMDYTGFDLCPSNVENARALFPGVRFELGNVFEVQAADKSFDVCFVHDLFEHLSLEGLQVAVSELCRVTRHGLCVGFFNMDEIPAHLVRPVEEYHWNTLSMARMKELFAEHGFAAQVVHIGTFLRQRLGCPHTHNPNAYTFMLRPPG